MIVENECSFEKYELSKELKAVSSRLRFYI